MVGGPGEACLLAVQPNNLDVGGITGDSMPMPLPFGGLGGVFCVEFSGCFFFFKCLALKNKGIWESIMLLFSVFPKQIQWESWNLHEICPSRGVLF